jgi:membrane fusion protein (multidrug efflux system)
MRQISRRSDGSGGAKPVASVLKQLVVIVALAGAGYGGWEMWRQHAGASPQSEDRARPAPGVEVAEAVRSRIERTVSAVGVARPLRAVELAALSEGRVVEVGFEGGDRVEAGQTLLRLEDADEQADLQEAEADLVRARNAFERAEALLVQRRIPRTDHDAARAELSRAEAGLDRARKALADRTLTAPFAGVVGFTSIEQGAVLDARTPFADLVDASALNVDFAVPERFFGEVSVGAAVRAETDIFPGERFEGDLASLGARIDTVTRSFTARARIPNPDGRLPADAFMRVSLVLAARDGVIAPEEAVVSEGGETFVYVVRDDRAERRPVTVGFRRAGEAEIVSGLEEGELVIVRGVQKVGDGRPVRVLNAPVPAPAA